MEDAVTTSSISAAPTLFATLFRGLADPARLSCLLVVRDHPCTVNEVASTTGLSQPNVSKHLACLRDCGLVAAERSGRYVTYRLAEVGVEHLLQAAEGLLAMIGASVAACPAYGQRREP